MKRSHYGFAEAEVGEQCADPGIREYLSVYILNPLEDPSAKEVEDHLLDCRHCREFFLTMLSVRNETHTAKTRRGHEGERVSGRARVIWLDDLRKERT